MFWKLAKIHKLTETVLEIQRSRKWYRCGLRSTDDYGLLGTDPLAGHARSGEQPCYGSPFEELAQLFKRLEGRNPVQLGFAFLRFGTVEAVSSTCVTAMSIYPCS